MTELVIAGEKIPYTVVRSNRARRIRLSMSMSEFRVVAPVDASHQQISEVLDQKRPWILKHHTSFRSRRQEIHQISRFQSGAKIPYWGRLSKIHTQVSDVEKPRVSHHHGFCIEHPQYPDAETHDQGIETALHEFLKTRFAAEVNKSANGYCDALGMAPKVIRIKQMSRRWGSCSASGSVSLDWRLVYAPKRVAHYVVAHELAHLKVFDHSRRFWSVLQSIYGDYSQEHQWLKNNEHMLGYVKLPVSGTGAHQEGLGD